MLLFRIGKSKYANDLTGEGAKINGGRWNHAGTPCIYTAESRALSLLEYAVHVSLDTLPQGLSFSTYKVPDDSIKEFVADELPKNWQTLPHPNQSRDFGTQLLIQNKHLVLKFPSAIIPAEFNYIINPFHSRIKEVKIVEVDGFSFDMRLRKVVK